MTSHAAASNAYSTTSPTRAEVDMLAGATVLEFGTDWCGYCKAAQPLIGQAFEAHPEVRRLKVEDGPGRPLGPVQVSLTALADTADREADVKISLPDDRVPTKRAGAPSA